MTNDRQGRRKDDDNRDGGNAATTAPASSPMVPTPTTRPPLAQNTRGFFFPSHIQPCEPLLAGWFLFFLGEGNDPPPMMDMTPPFSHAALPSSLMSPCSQVGLFFFVFYYYFFCMYHSYKNSWYIGCRTGRNQLRTADRLLRTSSEWSSLRFSKILNIIRLVQSSVRAHKGVKPGPDRTFKHYSWCYPYPCYSLLMRWSRSHLSTHLWKTQWFK